jgi:hypothetical protein
VANMDLLSKIFMDGDEFRRLLKSVLCRKKPNKKTKGPEITREISGFMPAVVYRIQVAKAPNMINSPWAMLNTLATPYCRLSPTAIRAKIPPNSKPAMNTSRISTIIIRAFYMLLIRTGCPKDAN